MSRDKQIVKDLNDYPYCEGYKDNRGCYIAPSCDVCAMNRAMETEHIREVLAKHGYRKSTDVAREIFKEIEREIAAAYQSNYKLLPQVIDSCEIYHTVQGKISALRGIDGFIADLKKKYESEGAE